jgi:predicted hydrocarbon binding protein
MSRGDIEGGMTVRVWDSFFASATKSETGNPGCFFVSGLLAGIADGLFGHSHNCMEKECRSAGSECCEFVVTAV